jgi:hypothetical protein
MYAFHVLLMFTIIVVLLPSSNVHGESLPYALCVFLTSTTLNIVQLDNNSQ